MAVNGLNAIQPNQQFMALTQLAPKPKNCQETGLSSTMLTNLTLKQLTTQGVMDLHTLAERLALPGNIIEHQLQLMKKEALVEVHANGNFTQQIRYGLTHKGYSQAQLALAREGYIGPAPIPLSQYQHLTIRQTTQLEIITLKRLRETFSDLVISDKLISQFGPALNSGRAIFSYGLAGTGKTYLCRKLLQLFQSDILIPYAIAVGEQVIQLFDPLIHKSVHKKSSQSILLNQGYDQRLLLCHRPEVLVGGELTNAMLEIQYDEQRHVHHAPLQMKANNGIFIIDDLGRQQSSVTALLNRWILPLEEKVDYLSLHDGAHIKIPFELVLIFSTNMNPAALTDEAFLRRIGYKIKFNPLDELSYRRIWHNECARYQLACSKTMVTYVIENLHKANHIPLLACHPRDLVSLARYQLEFMQNPLVLTEEILNAIWHSYFVSSEDKGVSHG